MSATEQRDSLDPAPIVVDRAQYYAETRGLPLTEIVPIRAGVAVDPPAQRQSDPTGPFIPSQLVAGRQTGVTWGGIMAGFGWRSIPRRQYTRVDLTSLNLARMQPHQVMEILAEVSPEVSQALWNNLLMTNSGYELKVVDARSDKPDDEGQEVLNRILERVNPHAGGLDGIIDQWHYTAYLQGAMAGEIVLSPGLKDVDDIFPVSPWTIEFVPDAPYPRPVQRLPHEARPRELNEHTFFYLPILPAVDDPYGRMPFASVLHALHFDLQLLTDLKVAVHANAWDKLDITVLESVIVNAIPERDRHNPQVRQRWVQAVVNDVRSAFAGMQPDDHFIHTDATEIKPVQSGNRNVGVVPIFRMLERRIIRGLKQLPILMGSNEGTTETHGTIQFEIYIDGIRAVQDRTKHMLEAMLTLAMQVHGRQSKVIMDWDAIRTVDRFREARSEWQEVQNAIAKRDQGWITQDDASIAVTGSPAVTDAPVASVLEVQPISDDEDADADDDTENDGDGRVRSVSINAQAQRVAEYESRPWRESEARIRRLAERYFVGLAEDYPADEVAQDVVDLYGGVAELVSEDDVHAVTSVWFAGMAALLLAEVFIADLHGAYVSGYTAAAQRRLHELGIGGRFKLTNSTILDELQERAALRVSGIDEVTRQRLARLVALGIRDAQTVEELAATIRGLFRDMSETRALAIAQTETTDMWAAATTETGRRNGISEHTWRVEPGVCEECAPNDGATAAIGQSFPSGHSAPSVHPRCKCWLEIEIPSDWEAPDEPWRGE
jgi:hypothetical protein